MRAFAAGAPVDARGASRSELRLPRPVDAGTAPQLVGFVQNAGTGEVLQVVALPLVAPDCEPRP